MHSLLFFDFNLQFLFYRMNYSEVLEKDRQMEWTCRSWVAHFAVFYSGRAKKKIVCYTLKCGWACTVFGTENAQSLVQEAYKLQLLLRLISYLSIWYHCDMPFPMAARSKAWVCCRSLAGMVGSKLAGNMDVCFECCVLSGRGLCDGLITRPDEFHEVCVCVCVCVCVWVWVWVWSLAQQGLLCHENKEVSGISRSEQLLRSWILVALSGIWPLLLTFCVGRYSSVGIAIRLGFEGPGIESQWGRDFPRPSRPPLRPTQLPVQ